MFFKHLSRRSWLGGLLASLFGSLAARGARGTAAPMPQLRQENPGSAGDIQYPRDWTYTFSSDGTLVSRRMECPVPAYSFTVVDGGGTVTGAATVQFKTHQTCRIN